MLQEFADWIVYSVFSLGQGTRLAESLSYFIYDSIKILIMLFLMIFIIGFIRTYISQSRLKNYLKAQKAGVSNFFASLFGAITPFCSCSSIPIFMGFINAGIPLGISFSFLITSPIVNEYLVVLMLAFFGWKVTAAYVAAGIILGTAIGYILGKMGLEKYIEKDIASKSSKMKKDKKEARMSIRKRLLFGYNESISITKKLWIWVLVGVAVGALIHNYIPQELIQSAISKTGVFTVPIATLIGVPMYGSCAALVPIAVALFGKGVPLGTALAFMMAVSALSLPEAIILRRVMKLKLIGIFFGIVALSIMLIGYLINALEIFLVG